MEFRLVFDTIPDTFDRYRPHYPAIVYQTLFPYAHLTPVPPSWNSAPAPARRPARSSTPAAPTGGLNWGNIWRTGSPETFKITRIST